MIKSIQPFSARMAPKLAIAGQDELKRQNVVLDPIAGSGTVVGKADSATI